MVVALFCILRAGPAQGQYSTGYKWGRTELDSIVSVRTPVRGEPLGVDPQNAWMQSFKAASYFNRFLLIRMDLAALYLARGVRLDSASELHLNADKLLGPLVKDPFLEFRKPRLRQEYAVQLPTAPGGYAAHRHYTGIDEMSNQPATMDIRWFDRNSVTYLFLCITLDAITPQAGEEKQQFFNTIIIREK